MTEADRRPDRLEQTLDHTHGLGRLADRRDHDGELVATEARRHVARAQRLVDAQADRRENLVAALVAPAVVDVLEVVQVEEEQRNLLLRLLPDRDDVLELLLEERPVRKAGQRVVQRQLPELLLRLALRGDVEQVALQVERPVVVVTDDDAFVADPHDAAVLRDQAILDAQRIVRGMGVGVRREHTIAIVRVQRAHEEIRVGKPLVGRVAEQRLDLTAGEDVRALRVERVDVDDQGQLLDERAVAPHDVVVCLGVGHGGAHVGAANIHPS